jgi:hypothetical protein
LLTSKAETPNFENTADAQTKSLGGKNNYLKSFKPAKGSMD